MENPKLNPAVTAVDLEKRYLAALDKWAKRVKEWFDRNDGPPPISFNSRGEPVWLNRRARRA